MKLMMSYVPLAAVEVEGQQCHGDRDAHVAAAAGVSWQLVALRTEEGRDLLKGARTGFANVSQDDGVSSFRHR